MINNFISRFHLTQSSIEIEKAFLWGYPGSGSVIQGHSGHGASKELMNPLCVTDSYGHGFFWSRILLVPLMHHDPSDLESLILIQITPKECTQSVVIIDFKKREQKHNLNTTEFNVQASS